MVLDVKPGVQVNVVGPPQLTGEILGVNVVEQLGSVTEGRVHFMRLGKSLN